MAISLSPGYYILQAPKLNMNELRTDTKSGYGNTAYHEISSMAHGHHIHKLVWLPIIGEQLYLEKKPGNLHNDSAVVIIVVMGNTKIINNLIRY